MLMPFQQMSTFCGVGSDLLLHRPFGIIGLPVDGATTNRGGARHGPNAIRQASLMLTDGVHAAYPHDLKKYVNDFGNMALPSGNTVAMLDYIVTHLDPLISNRHLVSLGGDHSITLGILRSLYKKYGPIGVIHFDAHCDTWTDHFGEKYGHGTWMYNAIEEGLVDPTLTTSIGVRSPSDAISRTYLKSKGGKTLSARDAMATHPIQLINQLNLNHKKPMYLSLDIDCLDPAYAPGTGTPEIGGLSTMWLSTFLDNLQELNWIGMDCVEVAPAYDHSEITSLAAATFCWQYLSMNIDKMSKIK